MAPLSRQGERGPESGTDVAQYRLANHPPVPLANLGVVQVLSLIHISIAEQAELIQQLEQYIRGD